MLRQECGEDLGSLDMDEIINDLTIAHEEDAAEVRLMRRNAMAPSSDVWRSTDDR